MAQPESSGAPPDQRGTAQRRNPFTDADDENLPPQDENPLTRVEATFSLVSDWLTDLQVLARAELSRTLSAAAQIVGLSLILLPLVAGFTLSLCAGLGLTAYYFFHSIYIAFGIFIAAQVLLLVAILLYQKKLRKLLGFDETRRQVKEAMNDVAQSLK